MDKAEIERVKTLIAQHGLEIDEGDLKKRMRLLRLLDTLYEKGVNKHDVQAIKEYFDRQLGKSKEHVEHTGNLPFNLTIVQKAMKDKQSLLYRIICFFIGHDRVYWDEPVGALYRVEFSSCERCAESFGVNGIHEQ